MYLKRYLPVVALALIMVLIVAACAPAAAPAPSTAPTAVPAAEPAPPAASTADKIVIAGVVFQSDTFMQTVQNGLQAAANEAGVELILGNTENDLAKESSMIDDYITRGVDAIVITPISADGSLAALKKAKDAGITIVCFNTCVNEEGIASAYLVTKNEDLGSTTGAGAVKFIEQQLGGQAVIGLLNCDQFEGCPPRKEGFLAAVTALPGVTVVADQAGWIADDALPVSEAMLEANPTINLLWAANEGGTVAHALAVQSSGLAGKVFVFGTDMNNQMAQMLQADDNILQGVTGQAPFQMGYDALNTTLAVLAGEQVEPLQNTPTILFARGDDAMINRFVETEGNAVFEVTPAGEGSMDEAPMMSGEGLTVAGVVFQSDTFMQTVQNGMQAAADEAGSELILGNTENDLAKESSMIDDYITRGVDAILITPISADGSVAALKKAKDAGITIICFNTCVNEEGIASAYLVTKNEDLGSTTGAGAVKFIEQQLGGQAVIGLLNCDQFEGCPPRKEGFLAAVTALPGVTVVADQAGWIADDALPVSEAMLEANPTINLLWAANEGGTVAHALAVQSSGLAGKVFVFGTDMNNQMAQMLQADDNILQGVTGQAPFQMGYDTFMTMLKVLGGQAVEPVINTPTILFARGDDAMINRFVETEGNAVFELE
jgi:sugar transport system substrate-binding protein